MARAHRARDRVPRRRAAARARRLFALMPMAAIVPVLLEEAVAALAIKPDGDLRRRDLRPRRAQPRDPRATRRRAGGWWRSTAIPPPKPPRARIARPALSLSTARGSRRCRTCSTPSGIAQVDGVLLDLGVSSPQIDDPARGFSLARRRAARHADGSRRAARSRRSGSRAPPHANSAEVIADYGEERFAQSIARAIVAARAHEPIVRTRQLAAIVAKPSARARGVIGVRIRPRARSRLFGFSSIGSSRNCR